MASAEPFFETLEGTPLARILIQFHSNLLTQPFPQGKNHLIFGPSFFRWYIQYTMSQVIIQWMCDRGHQVGGIFLKK